MSKRLNPKSTPAAAPAASHRNFMDGTSFDVKDPIVRLRMMAASSFFGEPRYYTTDTGQSKVDRAARAVHSPSTLAAIQHASYLDSVLGESATPATRSPDQARMEVAIDDALAADPEATLRLAAELRQVHHIRVTPQVILVRAAHHPKVKGTGWVRQYAPQILQRADEPATQLAYHLSAYGSKKAIPNSLKKAWRDYLVTVPAGTLAKYRLEGQTVKTVDVVNLCRPKATDAIHALVNGTLRLKNNTWEALISAKGNTKEAWQEACDKFLLQPGGHMALLRNLRNLNEHGLITPAVMQALVAGAKTGQQLPFRYVSAYDSVKGMKPANPVLLDGLEEALWASLDAQPKLPGRVMSLSDNSGSAWGAMTSEMGSMPVATIGNLAAVLTGLCAGEEGHVGVFGDNLKTQALRRTRSVFDQLEEITGLGKGVGQGTENGLWLFFKRALAQKEHWDHIFVYSDMQAGHGGLYGMSPAEYAGYQWPRDERYIDVPKLIQAYRREVNPNVMVYLVQTAGYSDTLVPDARDRTFILGGWGPGLLRYAQAMAELAQSPALRESVEAAPAVKARRAAQVAPVKAAPKKAAAKRPRPAPVIEADPAPKATSAEKPRASRRRPS